MACFFFWHMVPGKSHCKWNEGPVLSVNCLMIASHLLTLQEPARHWFCCSIFPSTQGPRIASVVMQLRVSLTARSCVKASATWWGLWGYSAFSSIWKDLSGTGVVSITGFLRQMTQEPVCGSLGSVFIRAAAAEFFAGNFLVSYCSFFRTASVCYLLF